MLRFNLAGQLEDVRCENELLQCTSRRDQCERELGATRKSNLKHFEQRGASAFQS